ncbi:FHA domain-containing protein [bacterium]|nr:FHA domain-containing protein [bacterium]
MKSNQPFLLKFTSGPMTSRQFTLLPGEAYVLGSQAESDIRIDGDPTVSRRHACLRVSENGNIEIMDLGSTNGSSINFKKIKQRGRLRAGDVLQLGLNTQCIMQPWETLESSLPPGMSAGFDLIPRSTPYKANSIRMTAPLWFTVGGFCIGGICFSLWQAFDAPNHVFARTIPVNLRDVTPALKIEKDFPSEKILEAIETKTTNEGKNTDVPLVANDFIWDEIVNISQRFGEVPPSIMDPQFVKEVDHWIKFYTKNNRHQELLRKRDFVWEKMQRILQIHGLPPELGYIAWVESAFDPQATSQAGAVGIWQFISSTASEYGLDPLTGDGKDARRILEPSTHAAARYLNSLLQQFGNRHYLLALAAYNAGQNRIKRQEISESIKNAKQVDFWHLREGLPKETLDYVPKVLAAIIIGRNPEHW